jgi:hypothetical protein
VPVYIASELILLGSHRRWYMLAAGGLLCLLAFAGGLRYAVGSSREHPRPRWFYWAIGGVAICYAIVAIVAGAELGPVWAAGAFGAGIIPMTAVTLLLASARSKTVSTKSGLTDVSGDSEDVTPGIGLDDRSPLGETTEHSNAMNDPQSGEHPRNQPRRGQARVDRAR